VSVGDESPQRWRQSRRTAICVRELADKQQGGAAGTGTPRIIRRAARGAGGLVHG